MSGISIISGTDREGSRTAQVANAIRVMLEEKGIASEVLDLRHLPRDLDQLGLYGRESAVMQAVIARHIDPYDRLLFVIPEYNGGFPGMLKLFIDAIPPRRFHGKQAALVGVSDGHAGNLRGLDHFQAILNYLRVDVLWLKPKLSGVDRLLDANGAITDERAIRQLNDLIALLAKR